MELTRWSPRCSVPRHRKEFSSIFDDFFTPFPMKSNEATNRTITPAVDIYEHDNKIMIAAELPGFNKEEIKVDYKGKNITFSGEKKEEEEVTSENTFRRERRFGTFQRTFNVGFELTAEAINAKYEKGVLILEISKPEEQEKKQVQIN
jgi:HSP20 family protein